MNKIKLGLSLTLVLALVIATNIMDNTSFSIVQESMENIYKDRLVAYDLLYKLNKMTYQKKITLIEDDYQAFLSHNASINDSLQSLIAQYAQTKLTRREAESFNSYRKDFEEIQSLEQTFAQDNTVWRNPEMVITYREKLRKTQVDLDKLSAIQLAEGRRQLMQSKRAINSSNIISKVEIAFIIIIGLILQFLIFYTPEKISEHNKL